MKQKSFQITTKRVRRSQQFQLRRQHVPCSPCSNREGSVANSPTCPQHDENCRHLSITKLQPALQLLVVIQDSNNPEILSYSGNISQANSDFFATVYKFSYLHTCSCSCADELLVPAHCTYLVINIEHLLSVTLID